MSQKIILKIEYDLSSNALSFHGSTTDDDIKKWSIDLSPTEARFLKNKINYFIRQKLVTIKGKNENFK